MESKMRKLLDEAILAEIVCRAELPPQSSV
jgi:hypothetical protein